MKKGVIILSTLTLVVIGLVGLFFLDLSNYARTPVFGQASEQVVTIEPGQNFDTTVDTLLRAGVIYRPFKFRLLARIMNQDRKIKAGEYVLSSGMTPEQILDTMVKGKVRLYRVTIPEGYNLGQIAAVVRDAGLVSEAEFMNAATDASHAKKLGIKGHTFEGYLFPETYFFNKTVSAKKMIAKMVERFQSVFAPLWKSRPPEFPLTVDETVTLASIIEKETGAAHERPLISSVFHNRLEKNMRLQSDPTVIYGIENFDGNLTRKHLETESVYNTYMIQGLPLGPIANPGLESLKAAIFPEETSFLYFVSKKDGTHQFTTNYKAHSQAVRKYQLGK